MLGVCVVHLVVVLGGRVEKDADPTHPSLTLGHSPVKMTYAYNAMGQRTAAANLSMGGTTIYGRRF